MAKSSKKASKKRTKASIEADKRIKAKKPGKQTASKGHKNQFGKSKKGDVYYESRANRTDKDRRKKFSKGGTTDEKKYLVSIDYQTTAGNPSTMQRQISAASPEEASAKLEVILKKKKNFLKIEGGYSTEVIEAEYKKGGKIEPPEKGTPEWHQLQVARQTMKYNDAGVLIMGGMNKEEAKKLLDKYKIKYGKGGVLKLYEVTVKDSEDWFKPLMGEFPAKNEEEAKKEAKEFYAHELDTVPSLIEIVSVKLSTKTVKKFSEGGEIKELNNVTQSGKPIYREASHPGHADFTSADHYDAAHAHELAFEKAGTEEEKEFHRSAIAEHRKAGYDRAEPVDVSKTTSDIAGFASLPGSVQKLISGASKIEAVGFNLLIGKDEQGPIWKANGSWEEDHFRITSIVGTVDGEQIFWDGTEVKIELVDQENASWKKSLDKVYQSHIGEDKPLHVPAGSFDEYAQLEANALISCDKGGSDVYIHLTPKGMQRLGVISDLPEEESFSHGGSISNTLRSTHFYLMPYTDDSKNVEKDGVLGTIFDKHHHYLATLRKVNPQTASHFMEYGKLMAAAPQLAWYLQSVLESYLHWVIKYVDPSAGDSEMVKKATDLLAELGITLGKDFEVAYASGGTTEEVGSELGTVAYAKGGYTGKDGDYSINVHGDEPGDYKILCKQVLIDGKRVDVCYHETNNKERTGVEVYSGPNYIVGASGKSYSRVYSLEKVPAKYKEVVEELRAEHQKKFSGRGKYAFGGVMENEKVANIEANTYTEHRLPFKGTNLEGKFLDNGDYIVLSHGHYPLWYWSSAEKHWYGNSDKYNNTSAKFFTQSRPDWNATLLSYHQLLDKMNEENSHFNLGGLAQQGLQPDESLMS